MGWEYRQKLKDPRWQKKRLEVFQRAGWKCEACGEETETLHVHHLAYRGEPWEAKDEDLESLCAECHDLREQFDLLFSQWQGWTTRTVLAFIRYMNVEPDLTPDDYTRVKRILGVARLFHNGEIDRNGKPIIDGRSLRARLERKGDYASGG